MSIIYDALQKIENKPVQARAKKKDIKKIAAVLTVVIICLGYLYFLYSVGSSYFRKKQNLFLSQTSQGLNDYNTVSKINDTQSQYPGYLLSGIIYEKEKPLAIINGKTRSQGDKIGQAIIAAINKASVELTIGKKTVTLELE